MPVAGKHADALRLEVSSVEVQHLTAVGAVPGVAPLAAAARNGEGTGTLQSTGDGDQLTWQAPGSETAGRAVDVSTAGDYLLEDGEDPQKWLRVRVWPDYLLPSRASSPVRLVEVYAGGASGDDVTAGEASGGDVSAYTITLANAGEIDVEAIVCWVDAATSGIEISADGVAYSAPTSEATGVALGDLAIEATATLYVRRTIAAGADADPAVVDLLHFAFDTVA